MKIKIPEDQVNYEQLKTDLQSYFPHIIFQEKSRNMVIARKNGSTGANILLKKSKIVVNGAFPTMGGTMLFVLCIFLFGFLIPLIVYLIVFQKNQKMLESEIGAFLQQKYGLKL
ncbi:MAG: hypothetical protein AB7V36_04055 [Bacteroidales bacterium]